MGYKSSLLVCILLGLGGFSVCAQIANPPKDRLIYVVDGSLADDSVKWTQEPSFPGGIWEMYGFIESRIHYSTPQSARLQSGISAVIRFELDTLGFISNIELLRSNAPELDFQLTRVLREMPNWIPARYQGERQNVLVYLPLSFRVDTHVLQYDPSAMKLVVGSSRKNWWLKGLLLLGAVSIFAALFFGLR